MKKKLSIVVVLLSVLVGLVLAGEDKYTVKVPGGLAFSEFRGYEGWQAVSVSRNERVLDVIVGKSRDDRCLPRQFPGQR